MERSCKLVGGASEGFEACQAARMLDKGELQAECSGGSVGRKFPLIYGLSEYNKRKRVTRIKVCASIKGVECSGET